MKLIHCSALALLTMFALPAPSKAQIPIEEIALTLLADRFGIAPEQVSGFLGRSGLSVFDAAPYYSTSHHSDDPVDEVWELRRQGLGWGQIAQRLGMHPGEFNKLRKSGAFDRDEIWEDIYEDRYGLREADLVAIRRRGGSIRDALPAAIIARASRIRPVAVYDRYRAVRDWDRTATHYNTDLRSHKKYARKSVKPTRATAAKVRHAKSKSSVKSRAHRTKAISQPVRIKKAAGKSHVKRSPTSATGSKSHGKGGGKAPSSVHSQGHGKAGGKGHAKGGGKRGK